MPGKRNAARRRGLTIVKVMAAGERQRGAEALTARKCGIPR